MKRKFITSLITIIGLVAIWWIAALVVDKEVILPLPNEVFQRMLQFLGTSSFYISVAFTLGRILISLAIAMIVGIGLGISAGLNDTIKDLLSPIIYLFQTIPLISFILILMVWLKSTSALIVIILLVILPIFYNNTVNGIRNINPGLQEVIEVYYPPLPYRLFRVYIPLIKGYILSAIYTCIPLGLKSGVMAEIFVQATQGIGNQLYLARTQIDMTSIFAWTLWMVLIVMGLTFVFNWVKKRVGV